jgi:PAS domain-containing protein
METDFLDQLNTIVCISDENCDIVYVNRYARERLGLSAEPCPLKVQELLIADDGTRTEYCAAFDKGDTTWSRFLPKYGSMQVPVFLNSSRFSFEGKLLRLDIVSQVTVSDADDDYLYTMLFESAYQHIETTYRGIDFPEENILACLDAALTLYQADRAFILELDEELDACQLLFSTARENPASGAGRKL